MIIEIADLDLKLKTLTDCLKIGQNVRWSHNCNEIFVRSDTQNKSNILIANIVLGIADLNPKLQIRANLLLFS